MALTGAQDDNQGSFAQFTRSQVAEIFGVSPYTITRWAKEGRLPAVTTLGGQRRYHREVILRLRDDMENGGSSSDDSDNK